jgi:hypothetical protein
MNTGVKIEVVGALATNETRAPAAWTAAELRNPVTKRQ